MKILLTTGIYPPDIGGPASYVIKLSNALRSSGHEPITVSLTSRAMTEMDRNEQIIFIRRGFLPIRTLKTIFIILFHAIKTQRIFSNGLYLESAIAARILGKPSIAKVVGDPIWERERNKGRTKLSIVEFQMRNLSLKNRLLRSIYRLSFNSFSVITTPSEELAKIVRGWGVKPDVLVIPNGIELPDNKPSKKKFDLVFVGRLVKWKNVDKLINLSSQLGLHTAIVGSGPESKILKELAVTLNANCEFLGDLERGEINKILKSSSLFVLLSQYEGLSFSLLESMAAGTTPIVSDAQGNLEVVTDGVNSLVVPLNEIQRLPDLVRKLLDDEPRRKLLGENARQTVKQKYLAAHRVDDVINLILSSK